MDNSMIMSYMCMMIFVLYGLGPGAQGDNFAIAYVFKPLRA